VVPYSIEEIELALSHAKRLEPGKPTPLGPVTKLDPRELIKLEGLEALLGQYGEAMENKELLDLFESLLYNKKPYLGTMPSQFTTQECIQDMLELSPNEPQ
jgi:hypothetical protein